MSAWTLGTAEGHQVDAEQLLYRAQEETAHGILGIAAVTVARAQVHATLALAAATQEAARLAHGVAR